MKMSTIVMKTLLIMLIISSAYGIIGFDCGSRTTNVTTISLLEVEACDIPEINVKKEEMDLQLIQLNDYTEAWAYQCKIEVHRTIYYCGMHSHISLIQGGETEYLSRVDRHACFMAHQTGVLQYGFKKVLADIPANGSRVFPLTFAGYIGPDGKCNGAAYADSYGSWESVVVQGTVKVSLHQQSARVSLATNKIHLDSGVSCVLSDETCIDTDGGYTFWKAMPVDNCHFSQYSVLYKGKAFKLTDNDKKQKQIIYTINSDQVTFALTARNSINICGYELIKTEHPKLFIFESASIFASKPTPVTNLDIFTYVNSKFVYVERHIRTQIRNLYRDVIMQRCNLERQILKNSLAIATQSPDQFAYNLMRGPGYMAVLAGEVIHIIKCIPIEVKVQPQEECYSELPVFHSNRTYFLSPKTHILKKHGTKIICNKVLPTYYYLEREWYKFNPKPHETHKPITLKPLSSPTWRYVNPTNLATSGIYTPKDLEELRDRIMFPVEKPALLNEVAREIHSQELVDGDDTLSRLINDNAVDKIVTNAWSKFWNRFVTFGSASAGVIAILMIIQGIKMLIEIMINGYALHQIYGWSIHLLAAIWNSAAYFLINMNKKKTEKPDVENQMTFKTLLNKEEANDGSAPAESEFTREEPRIPTYPNLSSERDQGFFTLRK